MERQLSISYNDPKTKKRLTRVYKYGIGETECGALLSIVKALNFIYEQPVKFCINEKA